MTQTGFLYFSIAGLELHIAESLMMAQQCDNAPKLRLDSFAPFQRTTPSKPSPDCIVLPANNEKDWDCSKKLSEAEEMKLLHTFEFSDADATCRFYKGTAKASHFYMLNIENSNKRISQFKYDTRSNSVSCSLLSGSANVDATNDRIGSNSNFESRECASHIRFGLWFSLGIAAANSMVAAIHSSTIVYNNQAIMFLGESGTGKSTHTRLWRENIEGATLLNDDSPFIGFSGKQPMVYGSPWSGKTPCYKDEKYPLRAIVRLSQAPHNRIRRLKGAEAIGALLPSLPPAFAYDGRLKELMFDILSGVLSKAEIYHLECLPNADAARLVQETLFKI